MNMNDAVKFNSIVRRNLRRKNVYLWPLRLPSLLGITMAIFMLMAVAAPSAHAFIVTYFDFNDTPNDFTSDAGQPSTITDPPPTDFPPGQFNTALTITTTDSNTYNAGATGLPGDGAIDISGNTISGSFCFQFTVNTTGLGDIKLSFDLASIGQGGQFSTLDIFYTGQTTPIQLTGLDTNTGPSPAVLPYNNYQFDLTGANNLSALTIQFCFSGSQNSGTFNHLLVDNITVTGVPEPSTYIGGLLGIAGLCWFQRRRLVRFRRA